MLSSHIQKRENKIGQFPSETLSPRTWDLSLVGVPSWKEKVTYKVNEIKTTPKPRVKAKSLLTGWYQSLTWYAPVPSSSVSMKQSSGNSRQQWFLIPWGKLLEKSLKNAPLRQHDHDVMCVLSAAHERSQPSSNKTHKPSPSVPLTVTQTETFNSSDASRICCVFPSELTKKLYVLALLIPSLDQRVNTSSTRELFQYVLRFTSIFTHAIVSFYSRLYPTMYVWLWV